uniref:Uncharacterized protein n=1 Tax=Anguilla anguilla TaxID=7936 RepID=A0A0E9UR45_ANGAN
MVCGHFSWCGVGPFVPVRGNLNATACIDILENCALTNLWQQFWGRPFSVSA